jgi:hypothetical protein
VSVEFRVIGVCVICVCRVIVCCVVLVRWCASRITGRFGSSVNQSVNRCVLVLDILFVLGGGY